MFLKRLWEKLLYKAQKGEKRADTSDTEVMKIQGVSRPVDSDDKKVVGLDKSKIMGKLHAKSKIWAILCVAIVLVLILWNVISPSITTSVTSSVLTKTVNISKLSTAEFTYNGIAQVYKDKKKKKLKCSLRYDATVKVSSDMSKITFDIDRNKKTVTPQLPALELNVYLDDENSISSIPQNIKMDLKEALTICREDAQREAEESQQLFDTAETNLKSIVEALIKPILDSNGYQISWD